MKRIVFETWCKADLRERWTVDVPDDADVDAWSESDFIAALDHGEIHECANVQVAEEGDRDFAELVEVLTV